MSKARDPLLDADHAAFLQGAVSLGVASRDAGLRPSVSRAWGCLVSPDRRQVTVYVSRAQSGSLLADIRGSRQVAVVASVPSSHRTIQLKGGDATVRPMRDEELAVVDRYVESFTAELERVGHGGPFAAAYLAAASGPLEAVSFTPSVAFSQTPGPGAGQSLASPE
jgi:hypothetical protein